MSRVVELLCSRRVPQVAALALMSFGFAGCSADMSTRLSQNSFSNPFASQPEATGAVPAPAVERRELPQYSRPQSHYQSQPCRRRSRPRSPIRRRTPACPEEGAGWLPMRRRPTAARDHRQRRAALGRGDPRHAARPAPRSSSAPATRSRRLSHRYNVSPAAILQANGYKGPRALSPGQQLIIPHQIPPPLPRRAAPAPASKPVAVASAAPSGSCRQSRRHFAQHRASQSRAGGGTCEGQRPRSPGQTQARHRS